MTRIFYTSAADKTSLEMGTHQPLSAEHFLPFTNFESTLRIDSAVIRIFFLFLEAIARSKQERTIQGLSAEVCSNVGSKVLANLLVLGVEGTNGLLYRLSHLLKT